MKKQQDVIEYQFIHNEIVLAQGTYSHCEASKLKKLRDVNNPSPYEFKMMGYTIIRKKTT
tara:strand:+ start:268 stop:447 length:180 start_codon:yes stop_codon:yes gene_type:complete